MMSEKSVFLQVAAAAAAKSLELCPTLCNPRDGGPPGSPVPGILQARTLEWVAISFSSARKCKVLKCIFIVENRAEWIWPTIIVNLSCYTFNMRGSIKHGQERGS